MKRLLIRADDLGYSEGVNYGIAKSVREGLVRNVGIMTNMPSIGHGLELLKDVDVCFGQHTNICVGHPIMDPDKIPSLVTESGHFKSSTEFRQATEDFVALDEVILEIEAQYQRFIELTGKKPSYFEGHAVNSANFFKGLEIVAARHALKYSPFSMGGVVQIVGKDVKLIMESMHPEYDPFKSLKENLEGGLEEDYIFITHPGYLDAYILRHSTLTMPRPLEVEMLCDPEVKNWIDQSSIQLVTYDDL